MLLVGAVGACGTPTDRYEAFIGRDVRSNEVNTGRLDPDGCTLPTPEMITGEWRLAVATAKLTGKKPTMTVLDITARWADPDQMSEEDKEEFSDCLNGPETCLEVTLAAQSIDAKDWETRVGDPIPPDTVFTGSDFEIVLERQTVPGEANPLLYGTPIETEVLLKGQLCQENIPEGEDRLFTMCGEAGGNVYSPLEIDLTGSTYGAVWVPPGEDAPHPLLDCDGTLGEKP